VLDILVIDVIPLKTLRIRKDGKSPILLERIRAARLVIAATVFSFSTST